MLKVRGGPPAARTGVAKIPGALTPGLGAVFDLPRTAIIFQVDEIS